MRKLIIAATGIASILATIAVTVYFINKPQQPKTYAELLVLSPHKLAKVDIALMNLLCAEGLPGTENLNIQNCLTTFDKWAELVKQNEKKYSAGYYKNPGQYDNSYSKYQAVNLGLTLKQDLKCGYNINLIKSGAMADIKSTRFFKNSKDIFLHGFIENKKGSCSSLPVLMVAIGRRCGYPLFLVTCKGHLFCRWDDGKERFNIETACQGVDSQPDSYYKRWPHPCTENEIKAEKYLKSLTPEEELGVFTELRAFCLQKNKQFDEAKKAYAAASKAFPESRHLRAYLNNINRR